MELKFQVQMKVQKPVAEVFDAVRLPDRLSAYFTTGGASAPMEGGTTVVWRFADFPSDIPVAIQKVVANEQITFQWEASEGGELDLANNTLPAAAGYNTTVEMRFTALGPSETLVAIGESGWRETAGGLGASYGNCQGWTQFLCCLKAWLEYGINLRQGAY